MIITTPEQLAAFIQNYRKQSKLSQMQIADLVGLRQSTVSAFENQPETIKLDTLFRILAATELEIDIHPRKKSEKHDEGDVW